jgi:hypothetical protein
MDAIDLLRHQVKQTYAWLELMVSDVSQEQANWQPRLPFDEGQGRV